MSRCHCIGSPCPHTFDAAARAAGRYAREHIEPHNRLAAARAAEEPAGTWPSPDMSDAELDALGYERAEVWRRRD